MRGSGSNLSGGSPISFLPLSNLQVANQFRSQHVICHRPSREQGGGREGPRLCSAPARSEGFFPPKNVAPISTHPWVILVSTHILLESYWYRATKGLEHLWHVPLGTHLKAPRRATLKIGLRLAKHRRGKNRELCLLAKTQKNASRLDARAFWPQETSRQIDTGVPHKNELWCLLNSLAIENWGINRTKTHPSAAWCKPQAAPVTQ